MTQRSRTDSKRRAHLDGQRATIVGLGREGRDLARFLTTAGASVLITDARSEETLAEDIQALDTLSPRYALGGHPDKLLDNTDVVYTSPGVPPEIPFLLEARRRSPARPSCSSSFARLRS
jgi:UDP-N-acetylmuramoylalanine--D-glutamate ligase